MYVQLYFKAVSIFRVFMMLLLRDVLDEQVKFHKSLVFILKYQVLSPSWNDYIF